MIHEIVLTAKDEQYAPPVQNVLRLTVAGPVTVIEIAQCDESRDRTVYEPLVALSVSTAELRAALAAFQA